jgi:hypothetical protein
MSHPQHDAINGGWWQTLAGWAVSCWGWATADMPGLTIILTVSTIALTVVKLLDAVRTLRADRGLPLGARVKKAFSTRPASLEED